MNIKMTDFLSSVLDVGWRISIKAAPNFYIPESKKKNPQKQLINKNVDFTIGWVTL